MQNVARYFKNLQPSKNGGFILHDLILGIDPTFNSLKLPKRTCEVQLFEAKMACKRDPSNVSSKSLRKIPVP